MTEPTDHELLADYARTGSDAAFDQLAARHIHLVHSAARRYAGNEAQAEEITQAVFLILARKAGSLVGGWQRRLGAGLPGGGGAAATSLAGWLYQTARLTAANALKIETRRQLRDHAAYMQAQPNEADAAVWREIAPLLDEAMGRLGDTDRTVLVLRFFEGRTNAETAAALGLAEGAVQRRVLRALEKLRANFAKQGVTHTAQAIAGTVTQNAVQMAPVGLAAKISLIAAKGAATTTAITALVKGTLKVMAWTKAQTAIVVGLGVLFTIGITAVIIKEKHQTNFIKFKKVLVVVQDDTGKPVEGATVLPNGFRVKGIHGADAYGWNVKLFGPPEKTVTDKEGKAYVKYPVEGIPAEKELTGKIIFGVSHPKFSSTFIQSYSVDSSEPPIRLSRGIHLGLSGYYGSHHQPVTNMMPSLTEGVSPNDWEKTESGDFTFNNLSPGGHLLQLMGKLPTGELVYSKAFAFVSEKGAEYNFDLEMKPGIRLEGKIDYAVPRPVKNGRVMISVRPQEYPALNVIEDYYDLDKKYGGRYFWHSYRPINEDGSFVFESLPPGEVDVVVLGDGFVSKTVGQLQNRVRGVLTKGPVMAIPQAFPQASPITKIVVITEPTATLELTATTVSNKPIEGVWVGMYPSVFRMWGMFGWEKDSSEEPYHEISHLSDLVFSGKTDQDGKFVLNNIPPETHGINMDHPQFQVPLQEPNGWRDRNIRMTFSPGVTNHFEIKLEPKGKDFIGVKTPIVQKVK